MRLRVRSAGTVVATLLLLGAAPARAAEGPALHGAARTLRATNLPAGAAAVRIEPGAGVRRDDPRPSPAAAFTSRIRASRDALDPATFVSAERDLLERAWGTRVVDPAAAVRDRVAAANHGDHAPDAGTDLLPVASADLNADGRTDTVYVEAVFDTRSGEALASEIHALDGSSGAELWVAPAGDAWSFLAVPSGDLDGDGGGDLLFTEFHVDAAEPVEACAAFLACVDAQRLRYRWIVRAVVGATGDELWSRTSPGSSGSAGEFAYAVLAVEDADAYTATNALVVPIPTGDHDGDGARDLVVQELDVTGVRSVQLATAVAASASTYEDVPLVATRADLTRGSDGASLFRRENDAEPYGAALVPVGDAVGDGTPDLLWQDPSVTPGPVVCASTLPTGSRCSYASRTTLDAEMLDGATLATAWSGTFGDAQTRLASFDAPGEDFTGDGRADLLLRETIDGALRVDAVSGADGALAWSRSAEYWDLIAPIGAVGGSPGTDLLFAAVAYDYFTGDATVTLDRVDGAGGQTLLSTAPVIPSPPTGFVDAYVYVAGDVDADGVADPGIDSAAYTFGPDGETVASSARVESGSDGEQLFGRTLDGIAVTGPAWDLDRDGADDLYDLRIVPAEEGFVAHLSAIGMPSGVERWSRRDPLPDAFGLFVAISPTGDHSGDGGADAVYYQAAAGESSFRSRIDGLAGATGAMTWGAGVELIPPAAGTGGIAGTVTRNNDEPFPRICAHAFETAAERDRLRGVAVTLPDGSYRIGGLRAGSYVVLFDDCGLDRYAPVWYDAAGSRADADPVAVAESADTAGIDAAFGPILPPANDDREDATEIHALPFQETTTNEGATYEPGEASPCGPMRATVWYAYTAPTAGPVTADTVGSALDTVMAVYDGDAVLGCNDDRSGARAARLTWLADAGETYRIQVGGYAGATGDIAISVR